MLNAPTLSLTDFSLSNTALTAGTKFTLISYNSILNPGTFSGLANNSVFSAVGKSWRITYDDMTAGSNFNTDATSFGTQFVTLTVVPEPTIIAMVIGGFGLLLGFQRTRRQRA